MDTLVSPITPPAPQSTLDPMTRGRGEESPLFILGREYLKGVYLSDMLSAVVRRKAFALLNLSGFSPVVHFHCLQSHLPRPQCYNCHGMNNNFAFRSPCCSVNSMPPWGKASPSLLCLFPPLGPKATQLELRGARVPSPSGSHPCPDISVILSLNNKQTLRKTSSVCFSSLHLVIETQM